MVDGTTDLLHELQNEYCPPLDTALFSAIISDFDLTDATNLGQLRDTLDALKVSAEEQQDLPFDPSGTGGLASTEAVQNDGTTSRHDTNGSREDTDITSLQSDLSSVWIGSDDSRTIRTGGYIVSPEGSLSLTGLTAEEKLIYLSEMFPSVAQYTIKHTLAKCDYDVDRSMDVLLNLSFFDSQPTVDDEIIISIPKGIEGFASPSTNGKRKGKNKRSKARNSPVFSNNENAVPSGAGSPTNKWDAAKDDLDFIHSRTSSVLKKEAVMSAYHKNHASCAKAIEHLATAHAPIETGKDTVVVSQVAELAQDFPGIPATTLEGLLAITGNSVSAANELARAMILRPSPQLSDIIRINAPAPVLDEDETPKRSSITIPRIASSYSTAQNIAEAHFAAGSTAFSQASSAYRRSKSDRLMGGAAAYYASVGRGHIERAKREASAAADAYVNLQSTSDVLDLHGVSVNDAVRIANTRVCQWWDGLGDAKYTVGGLAGKSYKIITGAGRHSRDGTSRLGPAVGKMLAREGWKVEVSEGVLTVTGKRRAK
ncbi:Smr domain protein [Talaromyces stipitatus ATCC 10500]|uniref:Smr domain protein n=1 Tax=Talaromyces stipitatus (strain ATCC 10500 / CBS 375.48 / QM 6759 / NRRL 1006) TaxID=441959 RepID=B8LY72_TALSN|nr:Smr domain protein [Talaromyces stipitatus ATCC 10500]EED23317.1 Smr domain protein [Talaromyces stipitatus ATCC 10500]